MRLWTLWKTCSLFFCDLGQTFVKFRFIYLFRGAGEYISSDKSHVHQISMVQWAMRLPTRHCFEITNSDSQNYDQNDGIPENGAIVCVGDDEFQSDPSSSPDHDSILLPKELEGLHEKYSATCRLFQYRELLSATSNFKPGLCSICYLEIIFMWIIIADLLFLNLFREHDRKRRE